MLRKNEKIVDEDLIVEELTNVSDDAVDKIISQFTANGAIEVVKQRQLDGYWTISAKLIK